MGAVPTLPQRLQSGPSAAPLLAASSPPGCESTRGTRVACGPPNSWGGGPQPWLAWGSAAPWCRSPEAAPLPSLPPSQDTEELCAQLTAGQEVTPGYPPAPACGPHSTFSPSQMAPFFPLLLGVDLYTGRAGSSDARKWMVKSSALDRTRGWAGGGASDRGSASLTWAQDIRGTQGGVHSAAVIPSVTIVAFSGQNKVTTTM